VSRQVLSDQAQSAFVALLRGHSSLTRELNAQLTAEHGLTLNDYEVLLHLSRAPDQQLKRIDLAQRVLLTASGITRLLDGLQAEGYVCKGSCASDARITYAVLTDAGRTKLAAARETHLAGVNQLFAERYDDPELDSLTELLGRLQANAAADDDTC